MNISDQDFIHRVCVFGEETYGCLCAWVCEHACGSVCRYACLWVGVGRWVGVHERYDVWKGMCVGCVHVCFCLCMEAFVCARYEIVCACVSKCMFVGSKVCVCDAVCICVGRAELVQVVWCVCICVGCVCSGVVGINGCGSG